MAVRMLNGTFNRRDGAEITPSIALYRKLLEPALKDLATQALALRLEMNLQQYAQEMHGGRYDRGDQNVRDTARSLMFVLGAVLL